VDEVLEVALGRHAWHVDAIALGVEFPAVIDAAQTVPLVAAEEQRGAAVRAFMVHDADPAAAGAEGDQLLAEQHEAHRLAIGLQLRRHRRRQPILPHHFAHRRARADVDQIVTVFLAHVFLPIRYRQLRPQPF
jgi:hypothetical protein